MSDHLDDPVENAGGSAPPGEPGSGTGVSASTAELTGELQEMANNAIDGLQGIANRGVDAGEDALIGVFKVAVTAQEEVSKITSNVTTAVRDSIVAAEHATPALTGAAQAHGNQAIDGIQGLVNHAFDAGEAGVVAALEVVDRIQSELSGLLQQIYGTLEQKISGPPKG